MFSKRWHIIWRKDTFLRKRKTVKVNEHSLAKDVLQQENIPLSVEEMWNSAKERGLLEKLSSSGKTPIRTLSARIYVDIKNNEESMFEQVSKRPAKFFLKGRTAGLKEYEEKQKQEKEQNK